MMRWFGWRRRRETAAECRVPFSNAYIVDSLDARLRAEIAHYGGQLPERVAIAWRGYMAGLLEWGALDVKDHAALWAMLPEIENDPVVDILVGREVD